MVKGYKLTEQTGSDSGFVAAESVKTLYPAGTWGKVGATAGWTVGAASDINLATVAASQTAATLVMPFPARVGSTIRSFHLVGQIESAGGAVTVDAAMYRNLAVAAQPTDTSIGSMTQISVTADTKIDSSNSSTTLTTPEIVAQDEMFYILITVTTAASTDVALMGVAVVVDEYS